MQGTMVQFATSDQLIYVVDDDNAIARLVAVNLAARGYRVKQFDSGSVAIDGLQRDQPDLVILDIMMPDPDGLEVRANAPVSDDASGRPDLERTIEGLDELRGVGVTVAAFALPRFVYRGKDIPAFLEKLGRLTS